MEAKQNRLDKRIHISLYAILALTALLAASILLEGCSDTCETTTEYTYYKPVYTSLSDIRSAVEITPPREVGAVGKIYFHQNYLYINEPGLGIHVINNTNPASPVIENFITIPGNYDLAIKGNTLYADSYIDLVLLDVSNRQNIREIKRLENVFSTYNVMGTQVDAERGLITAWVEEKEVKIYESACDANIQPWGGIFYHEGIAFSNDAAFNRASAIAPGGGGGAGIGGSMARFTVHASHLYTLDQGEIQTFDIANETDPIDKGGVYIAWDMETIFPYGDHLFIGAQTGMHIVDIATDPAQPVRVSTYQHVRVCDPVVVKDTLAFVTLRSGTECQGFTNQLEVINIKDVTSPKLLHMYPMQNPHGLGIDNNTLFICDGNAGLKVFDATDISKIDKNKLAHYANINAFDVIPFNNVAMMIGSDGIFQYNYSDPKNIKLLSKIAVKP